MLGTEEIEQKIVDLQNQIDDLKPFIYKDEFSNTSLTRKNIVMENGWYQSADFLSGSTGWRFDADGNLEASSGTFRGTLEAVSGTFNSLYTNAVNAITIGYGGNILLEEGGSINFTSVVAPTACTATLIEVAGNVNVGTHSYKITFVTDTGETELGTISNVVTTDATHKQVALSAIPVSTSSAVTKRKIYRTAAGGTDYYLLDTIDDNTTTTYTDNKADGGGGTTNTTKSPGTMADDDTVGTVAWTNPDNAKVSDNVYASAALGW